MGKYTVISDISKSLISLLRAGFAEERLVSPENIGFCDPGERENFIVGIHPYDIQENQEVRSNLPIPLENGCFRNPPMSMSMHVMISVVSKADLAVRALDEQRIMGKLLQIMADNARLPAEYMPESLLLSNEPVGFHLLSMELEDKVKIWSMFNQPYRLSVFYRISPIVIESAVIRKPAPRVSEVQLGTRQRGRQGGGR